LVPPYPFLTKDYLSSRIGERKERRGINYEASDEAYRPGASFADYTAANGANKDIQ
jgi:hypothetical protein